MAEAAAAAVWQPRAAGAVASAQLGVVLAPQNPAAAAAVAAAAAWHQVAAAAVAGAEA